MNPVPLLYEAHQKAAIRESASTLALTIAFVGSGDFGKAVVAAISTFGDFHGPVEKASQYIFASSRMALVHTKLAANGRVPGWGCSFVKGKPDPIWDDLAPRYAEVLDPITKIIHDHGHNVHPNGAAYTACVANELGISSRVALGLVIQARMAIWMKICEDLL